uniref:Serine proteinase stubble n=1 Tax=Culex pipiens TaxID=7175 RepID=A0A8D8ABW9_CULPI
METMFGESISTYTQTIPVEKFIRYPTSANQSRYANDLALIKLSRPADLSSVNVRPICIPTEADYPIGNPATVSGWKRAGDAASVVQRESVHLVDNGLCEQQYGRIRVELGVRESFLCVERRGQATNCGSFLSGTPLQSVRTDYDGINRYYLRGLYAFGLSRCNLNFTDVYVNVSYYGRWIKEVVELEIGVE